MPVFATRIRPDAPEVMGFLMAACGVGAVAGALVLASRRSVLGLAHIIAVNSLLFGAGLAAFGLTTNRWLASLMMLVTGFAMIALMAACNTMLQTIIDEDKRGRLMSLYTMAVIGITPFGSLVSGIAAEWLGHQRPWSWRVQWPWQAVSSLPCIYPTWTHYPADSSVLASYLPR